VFTLMIHATRGRASGTSDESVEAAGASGSSAERSLRLLALLARNGRPMSLADLCADLALPKGTVHRLCAQLLELGFVTRDVDERHYATGPALDALAYDTLNHGSVRDLRHQVLAELVAHIGETCNFTTLDGARVLYVDRVEAKWPLRMTLEVGSHVPLHCTASGKLFLAHLPRHRRQALIDRLALEPMTPQTLRTPQALQDECEAILGSGHACDREEFIAGLIAVAVPVLDAHGTCRAAIAVHAPTSRMKLEGAVAQVARLRQAACRMRELL